MEPTEALEADYSKIALIESFYVLIHDSDDKYLIVERKRIPEHSLMIEGPVFRFFHQSLVNALTKLGGRIRIKEKARIVNKAFNEEWNDYLVVEVEEKVRFSQIHEAEYVPSVISELEEANVIFFSKEAVEKLKEMGLPVVELPAFPDIIPVENA